MRLALISDIHANLPALEAVLNEVREAGVDQIIVGGDVLPGPMPRETMAYLLDLDIPAHLDALLRAYERFPEIGGRSTP